MVVPATRLSIDPTNHGRLIAPTLVVSGSFTLSSTLPFETKLPNITAWAVSHPVLG